MKQQVKFYDITYAHSSAQFGEFQKDAHRLSELGWFIHTMSGIKVDEHERIAAVYRKDEE